MTHSKTQGFAAPLGHSWWGPQFYYTTRQHLRWHQHLQRGGPEWPDQPQNPIIPSDNFEHRHEKYGPHSPEKNVEIFPKELEIPSQNHQSSELISFDITFGITA